MLFYYAYSGHKNGLERVRRGAALMNALRAKGTEATLLVNDFRAGLAAKELGVKDYVTVELCARHRCHCTSRGQYYY